MRFINHEIAHIVRVMLPSLQPTVGGIPILTPDYWYQRLSDLLDRGQLSHAQFCKIDSLMTQIERIQADATTSRLRAA